MTADVAAMLRSAADLTDSAVAHRRHAELSGPREDPAIIANLAFAGEHLREAVIPIDRLPVYSARIIAISIWMTGVYAVLCTVTLLVWLDPTRPWVLAATLGGAGVVTTLVINSALAVWDGRKARKLAALDNDPIDVGAVIEEVRQRIAAVTAELDPTRRERDLEVGRRMEKANTWLDSAEEAWERA